MARSFDYAVEHALRLHPSGERLRLLPELDQLRERLSAAFLSRYLDASRGETFVPTTATDVTRLLEFFLLEKCLYEIGYELSQRPDWVSVPLRGIERLLRA
jgi:maltose alpha-D-glucosyltransferase/alpha-amylase